MVPDRDLDASQALDAASEDLSLAKLLAAVASILRDSTGRFEETGDRIAQLVVSPEKAGAGVDIIVALQEFDRLRQDFNAIETILAGCARVIERPLAPETAQPLRDVVAEVPVVDFKNRLARRLSWVSREIDTADMPFVEEAIF